MFRESTFILVMGNFRVVALKVRFMTFPIFTPNPRVFDDSRATEIRSVYSSGGKSYRALAAQYGASKATIEHVIRGRGAYRHLRDECPVNFSTDW